jgi:hypothetical protein
MLPGISSNKGFGMIDAVMALCVLTLGVLSLISFYPLGWASARSSDLRSRASEIMHREFENDEALIMNPCNVVTIFNGPSKQVNASAQTTAQTGDETFTVRKSLTLVSTNIWNLKVTVTWIGSSNGISESQNITRQEDYRYSTAATPPNSCLDNSVIGINYN